MIDLKEMIAAGVHFGHKTSRWAPRMRPYIWGAKNRVHLIDVSKTAFLLERAGNFLKEVASTGGKFLFVGTKKPAQSIIEGAAKATKMPYVIHRWVGGTLSNYEQVKKAITRLLHMRDIMQKSSTHYKKKEISMIQKEIARLEKNVGGIIDFDYPPAAIVLVDAKKEHSAVREASRLNIPIIALVDTNTDPEGISFVIPANDDSPKSIAFVLAYLEGRVLEGIKEYEAAKAKAKAEQDAKRAADMEAKKAIAKAAVEAHAVKKVEVTEKKAVPTTPTIKIEAKAEAPKVKAQEPVLQAKVEVKAESAEKDVKKTIAAKVEKKPAPKKAA